MIEKLRKFILEEYAFKQKEIDYNFYKGIAEIIKREKGLEDYFRGMKLITHENESMSDAPGEYSSLYRTVTINNPKVKDDILQVERYMSSILTSVEKTIFKYIYAAHVVIHEMMHACQEKEIKTFSLQKEKSVYSRLDVRSCLNEAYMLMSLGPQETERRREAWENFLEKQYGFDVMCERDAEIKSFSMMYTILKSYKTLYPNLVEYERAELYESIALGYKGGNVKVVSPAYQYAHVLLSNKMIPKKSVEWYDSDMNKSLENVRKIYASTSDRLKMGLPVSLEEYKQFCDERLKMDRMGYIAHSYGRMENLDVSSQSPVDR